MKWFRWWHEGTDDWKLKRLSYEHRWLWIVLLTFASESRKRGYLYINEYLPCTISEIASRAGLSEETVKQGIELMLRKEYGPMLEYDENGALHIRNWDKRQFASDSSAERTRRYRERLKQCDAECDVARDVTGDSIVTPPDIQITYNTPPYIPPTGEEHQKAPSRGKKSYTPEFEEFWKVYPRKIAKRAAFDKWQARLKEKGGPTQEELMQAARNYRDYCEKKGTEEQFIMYASTFLGPRERWKDFLEPVKVSAKDSTPRTYTDRPSDVALLRRQMREAGEIG